MTAPRARDDKGLNDHRLVGFQMRDLECIYSIEISRVRK
jgi:hypothetical protein